MTQCPECKTHNGKHSVGCKVAFPAVDEVDVLRRKIALMREAGVLEADGIKLGPVPVPPKKPEAEEELKARMARERQRQHDIMFAASSTKPKLRLA